MTLKFCTLDVFTDHGFGGTPLAVFADAPELPTGLMQNIAREFNLSETVFIVKPRDPRAQAVTAVRVGGTAVRVTDGVLK
jgi:trans-2,3-dihydro-3-hydroxyanthranilate isomerase